MRQLQGHQPGVYRVHTGALVYFSAKEAEPEGYKIIYAVAIAVCIWCYKRTAHYQQWHKKAVAMRVKRRYGAVLADDS
jgi:hypothetical protein